MKTRIVSWLPCLIVIGCMMAVYGWTVARDFGSADTFEFQVTAPMLGIAHPTGYPLYLILGKLWTLIPFGTVAWRLNLGTAAYGIGALILLYGILVRLWQRPWTAALATVIFGVTPTLWSQAIQAEVYTLNLLIVTAVLFLLVERRHWLMMIALCGLGLTNHLTTIFLLPILGVARLYQWRSWQLRPNLFRYLLVFLLPLSLLFYLPIRWQAVNGETMGWWRFREWVTGDRFAGALQWGAWWQDKARWQIIGRIYLENWQTMGLIVALIGLIYLFYRHWQYGLIVLLTFGGYSFYALNYYVPDLAVFMLPAQLMIAIGLGSAVAGVASAERLPQLIRVGVLAIFALTFFVQFPSRLQRIDQPRVNPLRAWGQEALSADLAQGATILADSDKFPPLYYLQKAEGKRPDLNIMMLPDEAAYRAELDQRLTMRETVYLERYLPRLPYGMRSADLLTEVVANRLITEPLSAETIRDGLALIDPQLTFLPTKTQIRLRWQATKKLSESIQLAWRWAGEDNLPSAMSHPVHNRYPFSSWQAGEVVSDFYELPNPIRPMTITTALEVAFAPPFTAPDQWQWQIVVPNVTFPPTHSAETEHRLDLKLDQLRLLGASYLASVRVGATFPLLVTGKGKLDATTSVSIGEAHRPMVGTADPFANQVVLVAPSQSGAYPLLFHHAGQTITIGTIEVVGVQLPASADNFNDLIGLYSVELPTHTLQAGTPLQLTLQWQALTDLTEDYTVFIQLLSADDTIVAQIDSWPVQGTFPTSQWEVEKTVSDPYQLPISAELPAGDYHLDIGLYHLRDLRRLPILDQLGNPIDDKVRIGGLIGR